MRKKGSRQTARHSDDLPDIRMHGWTDRRTDGRLNIRIRVDYVTYRSRVPCFSNKARSHFFLAKSSIPLIMLKYISNGNECPKLCSGHMVPNINDTYLIELPKYEPNTS